jgi:hypothetical protein
MNARNNPIPAETEMRKEIGIAFTIFSRIPTNVSSKKKMPDKKTTPSAVGQSTPSPITNVYVKKAFRPIPGAMAKGTFALIPTSNVPIQAARQVMVISAILSIPASASIFGWTATIYDMVRKVVMPPINSRLSVVCLSESLKNELKFIDQVFQAVVELYPGLG